MTDRQLIKNLIPALRPDDSQSISWRRIKVVNGEGGIVYDEKYAVEIYVPQHNGEQFMFFDVFSHDDKVNQIMRQYPKLSFYHIEDKRVDQELRMQFEEALFQFLPFEALTSARVDDGIPSGIEQISPILLTEKLGKVA